MFANEDEGFQEHKQSIQMSENKTARKDDSMDVDALSKGKSEGKGKKEKGQNHVSKCWNCGKTGHWWRDCSYWWWSKARAKCKVTNLLMDGLGKVTNKLMDGGKRTIGRDQDSG